MATVEFDLVDGVKVGDSVLRHVVLGELTAGDILEAQEASERLVYLGDNPVLVSSPAVAGKLILCRQVKKLGDIEGPLDESILKKLTEGDFLLLERKAQALGQQAEQAAKELERRGRTEGDSGGD